MRKLKGKAPAVELTKAEKLQNFLTHDIQPGALSLREPNSPPCHSIPMIADVTPEAGKGLAAQTPLDTLIEDALMEEPVEGDLTTGL